MTWIKHLAELEQKHGDKQATKQVFLQTEIDKACDWRFCAVKEIFGVPENIDADEAYAYVNKSHGHDVAELGLAFSTAVTRHDHVQAQKICCKLADIKRVRTDVPGYDKIP